MNFEWTIIYNDGNGISVSKGTEQTWNQAPNQNVQYVLYDYGNLITAISGLDEYSLPEPASAPKFGKLISDEEWALTRQFMIYGSY